MPVYDYKCSDCGNTFSVSVSIRNKDGVMCPRCGGKKLKQAFTAISTTSKNREPIAAKRCG